MNKKYINLNYHRILDIRHTLNFFKKIRGKFILIDGGKKDYKPKQPLRP
jgi:hypothetical protein